MYAWTLLTEFNCQSTTHIKMLLYSIIFMHYFILFNACRVCIRPCFIHFCYAEVALPELLKEPHHAASYQLS